jgi:hypothetical protein
MPGDHREPISATARPSRPRSQLPSSVAVLASDGKTARAPWIRSLRKYFLSRWTSDVCAVESMPALRQIPSAPAPVPFDDIIEALQRLDDLARVPASTLAFPGDNAVYPPIT